MEIWKWEENISIHFKIFLLQQEFKVIRTNNENTGSRKASKVSTESHKLLGSMIKCDLKSQQETHNTAS